MTDSALSSLFPTHNIGSDGFNWWIGQIEQESYDDPKSSGRCKVRIVGLHPQSCSIVENIDLPWAMTMMPVSSPHSFGACTSVSDQLEKGTWVVGFFLDNDKQQPIIMGSVGMVANSTKVPLPDEDPSKGCLGLESFLSPSTTVYDQPSPKCGDSVENTSMKMGHTGTGNCTKTNTGTKIEGPTNGQVAREQANTEANPGGREVCVEAADPCGKETDLAGTFTRLFSEMLYEIQRNDGKLGTYLVGELSGGLYDSIDVGREYVDKAVLIMRTFVANVKGFVIKQIKAASEMLTNALLRPTDTGNALTPVTKFINDHLDKLGCSMMDLGDRLAAWLEEVIFGYLFNIYKATACQVDKFIQGILNKIQSMMNELLSAILGPLQSILGAIAGPLNMIGDAINYVLNLLGIKCNGPKKDCAPVTKVCSDGKTDKRENFLDRLLKDLSEWPAGGDWTQYTCEDSYEGIKLDNTNVDFVGGIQNPPIEYVVYSINDLVVYEGQVAELTVTRSGKTDIASSVTYSVRSGTATIEEDFEDASGIVGFSDGELEKTITIQTYADLDIEGYEDFFLRIYQDTPASGSDFPTQFKKNISRITIKESSINAGTGSETTDGTSGDPIISNPEFPAGNPEKTTGFDDEFTTVETEGTEPEPTSPEYTITSDKVSVKEGEFVTYTIKAKNVPNSTTLGYRLFGSDITPSDIIGNNLSGQFTLETYDDYNEVEAKVVVGIATDDVTEGEEELVFSIPGTGAALTVLITADTSNLSDEEIRDGEDESIGDDVSEDTGSKQPETGDIITDSDGGILDVPIKNSGDPYTEPPAVFITGNGYGAVGEVLLDNDGFAKEIRINTPGAGYKLNTPNDTGKECIIDSFTMLSPGREYTSVPKVWVNGNSNVAEAVINTEGQVISVRIKDRSLTFTEYPEIKIIGGGGYAAKYIPSFVCLDPDARVKLGSAKVGTGSYIDCP